MPYIIKTYNVVGSTFIVDLCDLNQDKLTVSFALTKDNLQIFFLNFVCSSLRHQTYESYNIFVNFHKLSYKNLM